MIDSFLGNDAEHELQYEARKHVSQLMRKNSSDGDPMVTGITVMLGTLIAMAVFNAMVSGGAKVRRR